MDGFTDHWHGASHVNRSISERSDMGLPCQWTNFRTHWHGAPHVNGANLGIFLDTDIGLPMSVDQFPNALTWGASSMWSGPIMHTILTYLLTYLWDRKRTPGVDRNWMVFRARTGESCPLQIGPPTFLASWLVIKLIWLYRYVEWDVSKLSIQVLF